MFWQEKSTSGVRAYRLPARYQIALIFSSKHSINVKSKLLVIIACFWLLIFLSFRWTTSHHKTEALGPLRRPGGEVRVGPRGGPIVCRLVVAYAELRHGGTCYCRRVPSSLLPSRRMTTIRDPSGRPDPGGSTPGGPRFSFYSWLLWAWHRYQRTRRPWRNRRLWPEWRWNGE